MSEYWKSTPKYWCKHCSVYVRDTAFEKRQHEATAKHQNNLKRFLRDIQNNHEREERDKERAKAEVDRLNKVVGGGAATTSAVGATGALPKSATTVRKTPTARLTSEDQKRQWSQLAQMGIEVPNDFRAEMAMAGEWKSVPQSKEREIDPAADSLSVGVRKRKLDEQEQEDLEAGTVQSARKVWGKATRTYPGDETHNIDDLLSGGITLKKDKQEEHVKHESEPTVAPSSDAPEESTGTSPATRVNAVVFAKQDPSDDSTMRLKSESSAGEAGESSLSHIPEETPIPVFKKRKAKALPAK